MCKNVTDVRLQDPARFRSPTAIKAMSKPMAYAVLLICLGSLYLQQELHKFR